MSYFLSYKYTGVPVDELHALIDPIRDLFSLKGKAFYCNLYDDPMYIAEKYTGGQIMKHALGHLLGSSVLLVLNNGVIGEGMGIEFGYAHSRMYPIALY